MNMPNTEVVCADVQDIGLFPAAELMIGCYPCQGFSQGGRRDPAAEINQLYRHFARALRQVKPFGFIVENVVGMTFGRNRALLHKQLALFRWSGYNVQSKLMDARNYGLAQERKRVFLVGTRKDLDIHYAFPQPTHGAGARERWLPQQTALEDFPLWPDGGYDTQPMSWYYMSRRRRRDWHEAAPCVVSHSRSVALHPVSPPMLYTGPDAYRFATDGPARRYSYLECAALQGFPRTFRWIDGSLAMKYRLVGNAVPPPLMKAAAAPLIRLLTA
jgi:DNA (cytosine-5)-methyltransferase 1